MEHLEYRMLEADLSDLGPRQRMNRWFQGGAVIKATKIIHECYMNANSRANFFELADRKIKSTTIRKSISIPLQRFYDPEEDY